MTALLYITDGTTRINLLTGIDGFYLDEWNPSRPGRKSTFRDSPLSDGRKPALMRWSNATETMRFKVARFTQDDVIHDTQDLERLLLAAEEYFIGGSDIPVWLEARGDCETNTRYAPVVTFGLPQDSDPMHKPFALSHPVMAPWVLTIERQHWRDTAPGTATCVQLSATQDYYDEQINAWVPLESGDDCYIDAVGATITLNGNLRLGRTAASAAIYGTGVRFRNVNIPQGADIIFAYVEFQADANLAGNSVNVNISCDDTDNSALFSTFVDWGGRPRTLAASVWSGLPAWVLGASYQTVDIAPPVQEVIDRPGWVSGNSLSVLFDENASTAGATRTAYSWDDAGIEPHLYVWWFDSTTRTFGRTATCNDEVYISNKANKAQLTHIFIQDGPVFTANLLGSALPFALYPVVPGAGDDLFFGIASVAPDSGPFSSLVFDLSIAQIDLTTVEWDYWNGAWAALTVRDNTNANGAMTGDAFDTTGVNSVHWVPPADWIAYTVNGVLGFWIRVTIVAIGANPAPPRQANRYPYTVVTPFVDTTAAQVAGDIQALAKLELEGESGDATVALSTGSILAGLRTYSRGADFTNFLNFADEQNPTGIVVTVNGGTATFVTDVTAPSGRAVDFTTGGAAAEAWLTYITIPSALVDDFTGEFRCLARLMVNSATAANVVLRLKISQGDYTNVIRQTDQKAATTAAVFDVVDFGKITLPAMRQDLGDTHKNVILRIDGQALAAVHAHLYDLILMPTDECYWEARQLPTGDAKVFTNTTPYLEYRAGEWKLVDVDSTIPRRFIKADVENAGSYKIVAWDAKAAIPAVFQPNEHQRWWFFQNHPYATLGAKPYDVLSAQAWRVARYLSMRGAR